MSTLIETHMIRIGNSHGIRIPKWLMDQVGLAGEVELEVQNNQLVIRPIHSPRHGWDEQFQAMAAQGDDRLPEEEMSLTE
jgi:antitoxin MazE